jgi:UPF0755 protein
MNKKNIVAASMIVFTVMLSSFSFYGYQMFFTPNILIEKPDQLFIIPSGTTFKEIQNRFYDERIVNDPITFGFLARAKGYSDNVKHGVYLLKSNMTNLQVINLLKSGRQAAVKVTFNSARKINDLAAKLTANLEMDSATLAPYLLSDSVARAYGFDQENFISMFLPNTYEVYWTSDPTELLDRMKLEYERFWTEERRAKAKKLGLTPKQVSTLASIVDSETNIMDEAPTIAGVYLNRIKKGYLLQADPTLVFAIGDFSMKRVLTIHKEVDSKYNTYKYYGLPPGPIMMPSLKVVEAVLNAEDHNYLYFCAKEDFSGRHVFAKNLIDHNANATRFQQALNKQRIFK